MLSSSAELDVFSRNESLPHSCSSQPEKQLADTRLQLRSIGHVVGRTEGGIGGGVVLVYAGAEKGAQ